MNVRPSRWAGTTILMVVVSGCMSIHLQEEVIRSTEESTVMRPHCVMPLAKNLRTVRHAQPLVGLFIGISNYGTAAGYSPTPAHTISAALFREPFFLTAAGDTQKNDLRLSTSLELDVNAELGRAAERTLRDIGGMARELRAAPGSDAGGKVRSGPWEYMRNARRTTRQGLVEELDRTLERAEAVAQSEGNVVFILYISAHGKLGADGQAYIVPSDATESDPDTWINQRLVLERMASFLYRSRLDGRQRKAVVVFDICRVSEKDVAPRLSASGARLLPINAFVVESTSPGSYAWHWTMEADTQKKVEVLTESRFGLPFPPPKAKGGEIDERFASNMSITPLASNCAISEFFEPESKAVAASAAGRGDTQTPYTMLVSDWLRETQDWIPAFTRLIPEVKETGRAQDMHVFMVPPMQSIPLLKRVPQ